MRRFSLVSMPIMARQASTDLRKPIFGNPQEAYEHASTFELLRTLFVLKMCQIQTLTKNGAKLLKASERKFGTFLTYNTFLKWTAYSQFCAGETQQEVKSTLKRLEAVGVGSILDYAAEADCPGVPAAENEGVVPGVSMTEMVHNKNVVYQFSQAALNENMKHYLLCVVHGSLMLPKTGVGFAAVKVTGLCDPQLLSRVSALLLSIRQQWVKFFTDEAPPSLEECRVVVGLKISKSSRFASHDVVRKRIKQLASTITDAQIDAMLKIWDPTSTGSVDYLVYADTVAQALLREGAFVKSALDPFVEQLPCLTAPEQKLWEELVQRARSIVATASELKVHVMIDAEQTYFQMAIDHIVRQLQRSFNKQEPIVYNTYQCYLTIMNQRLINDLDRAASEGWNWAGKMVRGAYMDQERATAEKYKYSSPIFATKAGTDGSYAECANRIIEEIEKHPTRKMGVLFGTHNQQSLEEISACVRSMKEHQSNISFAQLLGMADHLTIPLARASFKSFKYVPYGPIKETVAYLLRRGKENSSIMSNTNSEVYLIRRELKRRFGM